MNQDGTQIALEEEMQSEISKDRRDGFSKGGRSIPNGLNIMMDSICILQCNYSSFKLSVRIKFDLCRNLTL